MKYQFILGYTILLTVGLVNSKDMKSFMSPFYTMYHCIDDKIKEITHKKVVADPSCPQNDQSIVTLPYWSTNAQMPCMYSGTIKSSQTLDHNLFYWFIRNTNNQNAPLVLWLNGGPGAASMFGLFLENGPLRVRKTGSTNDSFEVYQNPEGSWAEVANVIYLDQPVGVGFSYGEPLITLMQDGADEFVNFMLGFYEKFPEFITRPFYITGESYAGKYIPLFGNTIVNYNKQQSTQPTPILIPLKGLIIGDPITSPVQQRVSMHLVANALNVIDESQMEQVATLERNCEESVIGNQSAASFTCQGIMDYIYGVSGGLFEYDARIFSYDWDPIEDVVNSFLNDATRADTFYQAIHIDQSTKRPYYTPTSDDVAIAYTPECLLDYTDIYTALINNTIPILLYAGEFDQKDGPRSQEFWIKNIFNHTDNFWQQARKIYYVQDSTGNYQVGGYYRESQYFTFLQVPKAGHFVPTTQLLVTKQFLSDFVTGQNLTCHKGSPDQCSLAQTQCNFMNNCSGNGTCDANGRCQCKDGYKGADCSAIVEVLADGYTKTISSQGLKWVYYQFKGGLTQGQNYVLSLQSDNPIDIFIVRGQDTEPTQFSYDMMLKNENNVQISSQQFMSLTNFTLLVHVKAVYYPQNIFYNNTLNTTFKVTSSESVKESNFNVFSSDIKTNVTNKIKQQQDYIVEYSTVLVSIAVMIILSKLFRANKPKPTVQIEAYHNPLTENLQAQTQPRDMSEVKYIYI